MFYDKRIQEVTRFNQILSFKKRIYASQHTFHIIHRLKRNDNFKVCIDDAINFLLVIVFHTESILIRKVTTIGIGCPNKSTKSVFKIIVTIESELYTFTVNTTMIVIVMSMDTIIIDVFIFNQELPVRIYEFT